MPLPLVRRSSRARAACALLLLVAAACAPRTDAAPAAPAAAAASVGAPDALTVMTFNLRFASAEPPHRWADRRPIVREVIERADADIVGTQEGLYAQLVDLERDLPAHRWIGLGREGGSRGEFMAVFYRADRLEPLAYDHFWLSDAPTTIGSTGWGNTIPRMVTWVRFRDGRTGRDFHLVNTHFDHQSQPARLRSAALLLERVRALDPALPVIVTGDFNVNAPTDPVYRMLTAADAFADTWVAAGNAEPPIGTFHAFGGVERARGAARIDWVLTGPRVATLDARILTDARDGRYPSDHFPVVARVRLQP